MSTVWTEKCSDCDFLSPECEIDCFLMENAFDLALDNASSIFKHLLDTEIAMEERFGDEV